MTTYKIATMIFSTQPDIAWEPGHCLHGFETACGTEGDDQAERYQALIAAAGYEYDADDDFDGIPQDEILLTHEDGRMAIVGNTIDGAAFVVEVELTGTALAHHRRDEIRGSIKVIMGLQEALGDLNDIETLRDALNELEEIRIEIKDDLSAGGVYAEASAPDSIDQMAASAGCLLDTCGGLPSWCEQSPISDEWGTSAGGRYLLYPPDSSLCGLRASEMLSTERAGWRIEDTCEGETYRVEDDGCVLLEVEANGAPPLLLPTDEAMVQAGVVLAWRERPEGSAWMLHDEYIDIEERLDRDADWNPTLWGWAS